LVWNQRTQGKGVVMPDNEKMLRVSRKNPCPICHKIDWCLFAEEGSTAICQRVEKGSVKKCGDAGWLHILTDGPMGHRRRSQRGFSVKLGNNRPGRDFMASQQQYSRQITSQQVNTLSQQLGVSSQSLKRLNVGWDGEAYTFPMSNAQGRIIGIRRRFPNGRKTSLIGSETGLFVPTGLADDNLLLICEGPTDCAAALDLGFAAIGRPSCNTGAKMVSKFAFGQEVVIIADNDTPGRKGAEALAKKLVLYCKSVRVVYPSDKHKDLRQWKQNGLTRKDLQTAINESKQISIGLSIKISKGKS